MILKEKLNLFFKATAISLLAGVVFFGAGYSYLTVSKSEEVTDNSVSSVPYYSIPENAGVLFETEKGKTFLYFDFEEENLNVIFADGLKVQSDNIYGYCLDYTVKTTEEVLAGIIDIVGGLDLEFEQETLNCTGMQVISFLNKQNDLENARRSVTKKIIDKIGEIGLSSEDFLYILENSETNLTLPDCYFWAEYMSVLCKKANYVN